MNWNQHLKIRQAAQVMRGGGIIAYPTEAVWGLGCDPDNREAVEALLHLKNRPFEKGMIVIAADLEQVLPYLGGLSASEMRRLSESRPVPTTWVVPASPFAPIWVTGGRHSLAVRITRHPVAAALCRAFGGPVVSTSANPSGKPPARTLLKVRQYFRREDFFIVPGPLGGSAQPSEIRDLHSGQIFRAGG